MATPQTELTMDTISNTNSSLASTSSTHKLINNWSLWAHLPQDSDWSVKSYKLMLSDLS